MEPIDTTERLRALVPDRRLEVRRVPLDGLRIDPANARSHGSENLEAIEQSLQRFGQAEPLVVQAGTGKVIGGNGRLVAMKRLGWADCDVVELDVDDREATALGLALNRTAELAEWDERTLGRLLEGLREEDALAGVGFSEEEVDELLWELDADLEPSDIDDPGPGELPEEPVTRTGDLWLLGQHRVLCGDSRRGEDVRRLLGGKRADLVWTDPPYGVAYVGKTADALVIENDEQDPEELEQLLSDSLGHALEYSKPGAVWYVAAPSGPNFLPFAKVLDRLGVWRQTLVWVKDAFVLGRSDFHYRHEVLFYGWSPGAAHREPPDRTHDTVWEFARPKASPEHPTSKPIDLVAHAIRTSSKVGDLVLDLFLGSGTSVLAAEGTRRRCAGIELDPRYVDVIVRRWEKATGRTAVLDGTQLTFAAVAAERKGG